MKVYFNSIGQFIKQDTSMDMFVKGNNGNVVECYFKDLDLSNPNLSFRLIIKWSDGTTTNELPMNKSLKYEYVYLTLPILKIDGMTQFIVRIYDYNVVKYTAIFERKIFENIEASDETNISSEEYQALQNSIANINENIVDLGLEIDNNAEDINKNNAKIEALQNIDLLHDQDIEDLQLNKQQKLVNQENIKSIDNETLLGEGNIDLEKKYRKISDSYNKNDVDAIKNQLLALINTAQETADNKVNSSYVVGEINKAVANLINNSPSALDTLQELARALNNDPNFATTIANQIGLKANTTYVDGIKLALQNSITSNLNKITTLETTVNENKVDINKKVDDNYETLDNKINTEITNIDKRVSANESNISKNAGDINTLNSGLSSANNNINKKLDKAQGTTQANKVAITNSNGDVTFIEKIPSANLPDTGVSVDTAKNVESSSGRIITGAEIEAVIDDTTKVINAKVDCDHRYEITGATGDEHNLAIADQQMLINKIQGRTLVKNQLVTNNDKWNFGGPTGDITYTLNDDNSITINGTVGETDFIFYTTVELPVSGTRKFFISGCPKGGSWITYFMYDPWSSNADLGNSAIFSTSQGTVSLWIVIKSGVTVNNLTFKPQLIDLTQTYGVGNEPTTVEEVLNDFPEYIPYDEGTFVHSNNELVSTGKNLWDEEWEVGTLLPTTGEKLESDNKIRSKNYIPILPNLNYYYYQKESKTDVDYIYFYDSNYQFLTSNRFEHETSINYLFTSPNNAYYMKFINCNITYNNDICINVSDESFNGTYEPYKEEVVEVGELKEFDYIDNDTDEKVIGTGVIDLGTLDYTRERDGRFYSSVISNAKIPTVGKYYETILCEKYIPSNKPINSIETDYTMAMYEDKRLYLYNSNYTDGESLKTSLNGVKLLYQLETPIIENDNLPAGYAVYKGGLQEQKGTIPYVIEKQYALSIASQVLQNIEIDREQQEQINDLKKDIANISFDGYTKEESDNKYAHKTTVSNINSQLSSLNANKLNAEQVQEKINQSISDLINSAPENLNTLGEIAQALKENDDVADALAKSIGQKIDKPQDGSEIKLIKDSESFMFYVNKIIDDGLYTLTFDGKAHICNTLYIKGNAYIPIVALEKEDDQQGVQCYLYVLVYEDRNVTEIAFSKDVEFVDVLNITDPDINIYIKKLF